MNEQELRPPRMKAAAAPRTGVGWLLVVITIIVGATALLHTVTRNKTVAVGRPGDKCPKNEEIERSLQKLDAFGGIRHLCRQST